MAAGPRLGIDFGTSHTVALIAWPDGRVRPLLFDGSPLLPSSVYAQTDGAVLVGRDAVHAARVDPARFEASPKRRIDDGTVLLGDREVTVPALIGAVLTHVANEGTRVAGGPVSAVTMTHPAAWGVSRRLALVEGSKIAGLPQPTLMPEPVAAAHYFAGVLQKPLDADQGLLVYDFGGGTFDASIVTRSGDTFDVRAVDGIDDLGGLDLDALIVDYAKEQIPDPALWARLESPQTTEDRRYRRLLWDDARIAKEMLSRTSATDLHVPIVAADVNITREAFEDRARPLLEQTVRTTSAVVRWAGLDKTRLAGVFLVGGSSRIPLVATLLQRELGAAPTMIEQPELVVAEGSLRGWVNMSVAPNAASNAPSHPGAAQPVSGGPAAAAAGLAGAGAAVAAAAAQGSPGAFQPGAPAAGTPGVAAPVSGAPAPQGPYPPAAGYYQGAADQPVSGLPVSGQPVSGQPVSGQPVSGQPVSGQPFPGRPVSGQPAAFQPNQPPAGQPAAFQNQPSAPGQAAAFQQHNQPGVQGQPAAFQPNQPGAFHHQQPAPFQPGPSSPPAGAAPVSGVPMSGVPVSPAAYQPGRSAPVSSMPVSPVAPGAFPVSGAPHGADAEATQPLRPRVPQAPPPPPRPVYVSPAALPADYAQPMRREEPPPAPPRRNIAVPMLIGLLVLALALAGYVVFHERDRNNNATPPTGGASSGAANSASAVPSTSPRVIGPYEQEQTPSWLPQGWRKMQLAGDIDDIWYNRDEDEGGRCEATSKKLHVTTKPNGLTGCTLQKPLDVSLTDAAIEAKIHVASGCAGMWLRTGDKGYVLAFCADGTARIHRLGDSAPGPANTLGEWTYKADYDPYVAFEVQGTALTVYIGGEQFGPIDNDEIRQGRANLGAFSHSGAADVEFSDVRVFTPPTQTNPNPGSGTTKTTSPSPTRSAWPSSSSSASPTWKPSPTSSKS